MSLTILSHPDCERHEMGSGHPESPARVAGILKAIAANAGLMGAKRVHSRKATRAELLRAHSAAYVDSVRAASPAQGYAYLDPDTSMNPYTLSAALHAAGAAVQGVDAVMTGDSRRAFAVVRPPGHHAVGGRAMGFCVFNNVAVAARHAVAQYGVERLAVLDFDVHHGNGTEAILADDPHVLFCSTFQHPYYPYSGAGKTAQNIVNTPLPAQSGSHEFRTAIESDWLPAIDRFAPELIMVSAGFDAHADDPLAYLELTDADYAWVSELIVDCADRHCQGRVVSSLEGGYDVAALSRCATLHALALN
jgi:acetoin utilization deacetylase AcuC-like enzyme